MKKYLYLAVTILLVITMTACNKNGRYYLISDVSEDKLGLTFMDKDCKKVFEKSFDDILSNYEGDYAVVIEDGQIEIIDKKGESLVDIDFDNVAEIYGDRAILVKDGRNTLYDLRARKALLTHDYIKEESNGIFAFMENGRWGYRTIDKIVVEPSYDEAYSFGKDFAVAIKGDSAYRVKKDGTGSALPYSEVIKTTYSDYLIATLGDKVSLLNLDGDVLFDKVKGDIVDVNYDMISVLERSQGKIQNAIYSVKGKELQAPIHDEVRLLSKKYFSAFKDGGFALFNIDGRQLTDYKFSYINAENFDKNGGIITAIEDENPVYLDKNGQELDGPRVAGVIDLVKDENFYILRTEGNTFYFNKDFEEVYRSPYPTRYGEILVLINLDGPARPMIFNSKLPEDVNRNLKEAVDRVSSSDKRQINLNLRGDILDVTVSVGDEEASFMFDIGQARVVEIEDIFKGRDIIDWIGEKSSFKDQDSLEMVGFRLLDNLEVSYRQGDRLLKETFKYDGIEPFINKDGGSFFRAILAPSINVGHD